MEAVHYWRTVRNQMFGSHECSLHRHRPTHLFCFRTRIPAVAESLTNFTSQDERRQLHLLERGRYPRCFGDDFRFDLLAKMADVFFETADADTNVSGFDKLVLRPCSFSRSNLPRQSEPVRDCGHRENL